MAKKEEIVKKTTKITIHFQGESATIIRQDNFPMIIDKTEKSVEWLAAKGFKPAEIEIIGEKPSCWINSFPEPVTV